MREYVCHNGATTGQFGTLFVGAAKYPNARNKNRRERLGFVCEEDARIIKTHKCGAPERISPAVSEDRFDLSLCE